MELTLELMVFLSLAVKYKKKKSYSLIAVLLTYSLYPILYIYYMK